MIRRPQKSTLFPSTTLFRPRRPGRRHVVRRTPAGGRAVARQLARAGAVGVHDEHLVVAVAVADERDAAPVRGPEDRKSTRLNSSHANISYAVFCLKKKKLSH